MPECRADKHRSINKNVGLFAVYCFGYFLNVGSFVAVCGLQSSINIEASVGTISLGIAYVVSFLTALFVTPTVVRRFGSKYALVVGEIGHLLYVAVNFYPTRYLMMATGVVLGVGEGMIWTALPMFSSFFGIQHGRHGSKQNFAYIRKYGGMFFGAHSLGLVFGFAVTYAFLYGGNGEDVVSRVESTPQSSEVTTQTHQNTSYLENITIPSSVPFVLNHSDYDPFQYCGSRDCQNPEITEAYLHRYVPEDKTYLYILLAVFCVLSLVGILLHVCLLPRAKPEALISSKTLELLNKEREIQSEQRNGTISTIAATLRHIVSPSQALLMPLVVHGGLFYGFHLSELTRAFTACLLGVEKVGLCLMIFCAVCALSSFSFPRLVGLLGRNKMMAGFFVLDMSNYAFCLLWRPRENTLYAVFIIFALFGITEPGWKMCAWNIHSEYFPNNQEIAMTIWSLFFTIGVATSFVWSPALCVGEKIYIQSTILTIGVLGYAAAEFWQRRSTRKANNNNDIAFITNEEENQMLAT